MNNRFNSPFVIVGPPGVDENSVAEILKVIGTQASTAGELFPKVAHEGPCRICGEIRMLTEEHIPPRGAFNKERGRTVEVGALLGREELEMPDEGEVFQHGSRRVRSWILPCAYSIELPTPVQSRSPAEPPQLWDDKPSRHSKKSFNRMAT